MPNTAIFVRSPYILSQAGVANDTTKCELFLWNDPASIPATPTRTLSKPIPSSIQTTVYYDISEYCRDYIAHLKYNEVITDTPVAVGEYCYCTAKVYLNEVLEDTYTFVCFDGYGYFADGMNPTSNNVLMDEGTYQIKTNANSGGITIHNDGVDSWGVTYKPLGASFPTYTDAMSGVSYAPYINENFKGTGGNRVEVTKDDGVNPPVVMASFTFLEVCEPKYTPVNLDFINRWGVWQRIVCFKASFDNFDVMSNEFNMMSPTPNYSIYANRKQTFNTNGNDKIRVNTGIVDESYKGVIKQIMLSEKIMLDDKPVKLSSKSIELPKSVNKKIINYEMSFEYAYQTINTIQ